MLYGEIITVCSQIHTKHINAMCGQNGELLNVKLAVRGPTVTSTLQKVITISARRISLLRQAIGKALPSHTILIRRVRPDCSAIPRKHVKCSQVYSQTVSTVHTAPGYFLLRYCQGSHRIGPEISKRQTYCLLALTPRWKHGPKREQVTGGRRKLCNEKLCGLYYWRNITREHRTRTKCDRRQLNTRFWWGNLKERGHLEDLGVDGRVILTWILTIWRLGVDGRVILTWILTIWRLTVTIWVVPHS